ncbi:MAG: hypothetical protein GYA21_07670 [Myxococcales bacterium]|nr:hypothetical protein [Myxococcales bacterium]
MKTGFPICLAVVVTAACAGATPKVYPIADKDSLALRVGCTPAEAEVFLDGVFQGTCASLSRPEALVRTSGGTHTLEVAARGFIPHRTVVEGSGITAGFSIRLRAATDAAGD